MHCSAEELLDRPGAPSGAQLAAWAWEGSSEAAEGMKSRASRTLQYPLSRAARPGYYAGCPGVPGADTTKPRLDGALKWQDGATNTSCPWSRGSSALGGAETRPVANFGRTRFPCLPLSPDTRWSPLQRLRRRGGGGWTSRACYPSCRGDRAERGVSTYGPACDARHAFPDSLSGGTGRWQGELHRHTWARARTTPRERPAGQAQPVQQA